MENAGNSTVVIDISKLQSFLRHNSDQHCISCHTSETVSKTPSTICKVQQLIHDRDIYKIDYEPIFVSIGPYHRGNENLQCMEKVKWDCLQYMLKANPERTLHDYIEALWKLYPVARSYYDEDIKMKSTTFVHMLLLDGCYIIASICGPQWNIHNRDHDEHMELLEQGLVGHDLFLMENQIPFFIVVRIYELSLVEKVPYYSQKRLLFLLRKF